MKSTKSDSKVDKYPCLKENSNRTLVILFIRRNTGVVVSNTGDAYNKEGEYKTDWLEDEHFHMFQGEVTLSN